jgi:hypothetical protein
MDFYTFKLSNISLEVEDINLKKLVIKHSFFLIGRSKNSVS